MFLTITIVIAVAMLAVIFGRAAIAKPAFVIRVRGSRAETVSGQVKPGFLEDCESICRMSSLDDVEVRGFTDGRTVRLDFKGVDGKFVQQRFRNAWQFHDRP